uniref:MBL fold metallo-hydrolase n=1 Tax=Oscillibacter sp. CU971 TaxID=2780102 RepID=UPI00195D1D7A
MYELIQVSERSYYIQSPAKIGLARLDGQEVCLIDSGNDKDAGRKVRQLLDTNSWRLTAIYNTHSNADHIGGNRYLQGQTGCMIYAPGIDCAFTRHPVLEPSFLYGGYPCLERIMANSVNMGHTARSQKLPPEKLIQFLIAAEGGPLAKELHRAGIDATPAA